MTNRQTPFALGTFSIAGAEPFGALVVDEHLIALKALCEQPELKLGTGADTVLGALQDWSSNLAGLRAAADQLRAGNERLRARCAPLSLFKPEVPVATSRIFCAAANYRGHVGGMIKGDASMRGSTEDPEALARAVEAQLEQRAKNGKPFCFSKLPTSLVGAQNSVIIPRGIQKLDWELELAVIIGRPAHRVSASEALGYVAGYAIINDITARELVFRREEAALGADWLASKSQPTFAPFGPYLVPAEFIPDPYDLRIQLAVNGRVMQNECTSDMLIRIERQIEWLASLMPLVPGDVIATGSPAGNGSMHGVFLCPGDVMESSITGLGKQRNVCAAEA